MKEIKVDLLKLREEDPAAYGLTRASLIQKLIRRSLTAEALWVTKLFIEDGHTKGLHRRLLQIAVEDVGLSLPNAIELLENEPDLYKQTALLCMAPKNREIDRFLLSVAYNPEKYKNHPDPQVLKEVKTLELLIEVSGKWFENKRKKDNLEILKAIFKKLSENNPFASTIMKSLDIYLDLSRANVHGARVMLGLAAILGTRKIMVQNPPNLENLPEMKEANPVPDFALDRHTPAGRMMKRDFNHWVKEGAVVTPEFIYPELYDKNGKEKYPLEDLLPFFTD